MCFLFFSIDELMHQSFASPAPPGPGNSGAFNFSIFKARLKARHCRARVLVKPLLEAPAPGADNNVEQQLGVVLMKLKRGRRASFYACKCLGAFGN